MRKIAFTLFAAGAVFAAEASAQVMVRASSVPPGQRPPDGMCRVWIEGVAPGRQPRPTDCVTARATAPLNSRIIYGSDAPFPGRAVGRFRDGNCDFERRGSNLGDLFFGLRTSQRDLDRDCRVSTSRTRDLGVWYPVGRDRNGNVVYERRVRDRNGRIIAERARSRDGRTLARIAANGRVNSDRDWDDDDDDDDRRISKAERDRRKAIEKARRDREKAVRRAKRDRQKAIERARRDAERDARRRAGRGNGRPG
ncbi:hypothetical protein BH23GEM1_BH23GEM1_07350 [soil metagenome]